MADAPNVKLPGVGKVKPIYVVGGLGIVLGIVGYAWWKNGKTASAGDTSGAADAQASQDSYIPPYAAYNTTGGTDLSLLPPLDNAAWGQRVQDALVNIGFDPLFVSTTIGKYLGRQPLTPTEADLVRSAIASIGLPPVGQFAIIPASNPPVTNPPPSGGGGGGKTKTVTREGHLRLTANTSWGTLAHRYAGNPNDRTSVYSTKLWLLRQNPTIVAKIGTADSAMLHAGWIVIYPQRVQVAA